MTLEAEMTVPEPTETSEPPGFDSEAALVQHGLDLLRRFLQAEPGARATIDRTIRQHLDHRIDDETWGHVFGGLKQYAGEEIATFVLMYRLGCDLGFAHRGDSPLRAPPAMVSLGPGRPCARCHSGRKAFLDNGVTCPMATEHTNTRPK